VLEQPGGFARQRLAPDAVLELSTRGLCARAGRRYVRWAPIEAAQHAAHSPAYPYRDLYEQTRARIGRNRGGKVARS